MHWLHSELQTIIYTAPLPVSCHPPDMPLLPFSLSTLSLATPASTLIPLLLLLLFPPALLHSSLLKIQVTFLNNLSRKSFGSTHQIAHYGLWSYIRQPHLYLFSPFSLPPPLFPVCISFTEMSRICVCKNIHSLCNIL